MEFDSHFGSGEIGEPVLLHFTPLLTDSFTPYRDCSDEIMAGPPTPMVVPQPPPYGAERSFDTSFQNQQQQTYPTSQVPSPAVASSNCEVESLSDLDSIEMLALLSDPSIADVDIGPQPVPVHSPPQPEEPPRKKGSAYSSSCRLIHSNPHSPSDVRRRTVHDGLRVGKSRFRQSLRSPRAFKRATSPMFPDQSTPFSCISLQASNNSICSAKSDPFGTISSRRSATSDPGVYHVQSGYDSALNSPTMSIQGSEANSPRFTFGQTPQLPELNTTKTCMELEMPMKYVRKITDLDKRILKLQAERSKLLEKAHQTKLSDVAIVEDRWASEKASENGKVHLYLYPLGIYALDEPLYEEANSVMRHIGGLCFELHSAMTNLRNICCKGMFIVPDLSTCFAYIKSLLQENQKLKLAQSLGPGVYRIQLESETGYMDIVPPEFIEALGAANEVLKCAQHITLLYSNIEVRLRKVRETAAEKVEKSDSICQTLGIVDRERRNQIRSILEGNLIAVASAMRTWPQYYQTATEAIQTITECIHPSTNMQ